MPAVPKPFIHIQKLKEIHLFGGAQPKCAPPNKGTYRFSERFLFNKWLELVFEGFLLSLIVLGIAFRLSWTNWSQGTNLHPDEYGLTNTLTQLRIPKNISDYFNTRLSSISPYNKYNVQGQVIADGPDNRMRWGQWPIIIIRAAGELTGNTGYSEIRLLGRRLSAYADIISILFIFLIGERLYNRKAGLLAAALSALAVLQIQQSHFMTVDNFGLLFTVLAMYAGVRIAQKACATRTLNTNLPGDLAASDYQADRQALVWYAVFGISFGMALASKVNLLPLGGMLLPAAFISIADLKVKTKNDLPRIFGIAGLYLAFAGLVALLTFRVTQPMSFRAPSGETTIFTLHLNPDWVESMRVAQNESNGIGGGPPGEQWVHRPAIIFPLVNMVLWGLGLPLGIAGWVGFLVATWQLIRNGKNWKSHLLPLVWTAGYFLFMGTRWVKSIRYFLPIYPFICLFAAWGLLSAWHWGMALVKADSNPNKPIQANLSRLLRTVIPASMITIVIWGTLSWSLAFTSAVYRQDPTRIQATRWIFQNIPAPFQLAIQSDSGIVYAPVSAPDGLQITRLSPYMQSFIAPTSGKLSGLILPHVSALGAQGNLRVVISIDPEGKMPLDEAQLAVNSAGSKSLGGEIRAVFHGGVLQKGQGYLLLAFSTGGPAIKISRSVIANESWDEGLPVPFDGWDPFGQLYRGMTMETRWIDDADKRQMFIDTLSKSDYVILPSQRSIWSTCRIPLTYPMTMEYYRALFDGSLGFDLAAVFTAPLQLGPLEISDVGGTLAWNKTPDLPLFNHSLLAAEEAFSVYDHPPVWIFKKNSSFNIQAVQGILNSVDLTKVVVQGPRDATGVPCP
jgi:hypothetical protein